jgi:hypothetical protein
MSINPVRIRVRIDLLVYRQEQSNIPFVFEEGWEWGWGIKNKRTNKQKKQTKQTNHKNPKQQKQQQQQQQKS